MSFTAGDTFALKAAVLGGGGPATVRQLATVPFSDIDGAQTFLVTGVFTVESDLTGDASLTIQSTDGTAPGTLGLVITIPRDGGTITGVDNGVGLTLGTIEQHASDSGAYAHFAFSVVLPTPGAAYEWELVIDPDTAATGAPALGAQAGYVSPLVFQHLSIQRAHVAILD
jgi:hypothetical protein